MNNSYWWQSLPEWKPLAPVVSDEEFDVIIIGAGYTGLWSAYFLLQAQPDIKIGIFESNHAGYGASGRNGGWVSSFWPASLEKISKSQSKEIAVVFQNLLHQLVIDFGHTLRSAGIDADFQHAGTINLARTQPQLDRLNRELKEYRNFGFTVDDYDLISNPELLPRATNVLAGLTTPHCASIHPAKLVRELAKVVLNQGARIFENSNVTQVATGKVKVNNYTISAKQIIVATEGYSHEINPRVTAPIHSLMFVTSPIPEDLLNVLRLKPGITFNDARNLIIYGQRTKDNRIAFGGRGAPYRFGSKTGTRAEYYQPAFNYLQNALIEMFPQLTDYVNQATHTWGGPIGVARDWQPSLTYNHDTGIARAGNYVGDGVLAAYLAGQTLADILLSKVTDRTNLPWVNHKSRKWEIEPFRYLLINAARVTIDLADNLESRAGKETNLTRLLWRLLKG